MFWRNQIVTRYRFFNISVGQQVQIPTTGSFSFTRTNENGFMIVDVFDFLLHPEKLLNCG